MAKRIILIVGPTASGKSEVAIKLAQKIKGEIISCDSMHVYRGMDIGTAKPMKTERRQIPHHLIDLISPRKPFSVFRYRQLALKAIQNVKKRGKVPIVVGGSGLYVKSILDGLSTQPGRKSQIRNRLEEIAREKGSAYLYVRLKAADPKRAERVHPNDWKKIVRALEVWQLSGRAISDWETERGAANLNERDYVMFGFLRDRNELYERAERRVDQMFRDEWIQEVKRLKRKGFSRTAREAIGYKEILKFLSGAYTLSEAISETKKRTRRLVKKQMTWFRHDPRVRWVSVSGNRFAGRTAQQIVKELSHQKEP